MEENPVQGVAHTVLYERDPREAQFLKVQDIYLSFLRRCTNEDLDDFMRNHLELSESSANSKFFTSANINRWAFIFLEFMVYMQRLIDAPDGGNHHRLVAPLKEALQQRMINLATESLTTPAANRSGGQSHLSETPSRHSCFNSTPTHPRPVTRSLAKATEANACRTTRLGSRVMTPVDYSPQAARKKASEVFTASPRTLPQNSFGECLARIPTMLTRGSAKKRTRNMHSQGLPRQVKQRFWIDVTVSPVVSQ